MGICCVNSCILARSVIIYQYLYRLYCNHICIYYQYLYGDAFPYVCFSVYRRLRAFIITLTVLSTVCNVSALYSRLNFSAIFLHHIVA